MQLFSSKRVLIIAEMANSHEGDLERAKTITEAAAKAGANAIKYQKFTADELAERDHENYKLYKRLEMSEKKWLELIRFAKKAGLRVFVDVFGIKSTQSILHVVDGIKIHSADMTNPTLLRLLAGHDKPILLSTAGCYLNEIDEALKVLGSKPKEIALMHGFQGYPTDISDVNLNRMKKLYEKYGLPIGIMDHVSGDSKLSVIIPLLGISAGATIVEKHITLNRSLRGLDYYSALNPDEFADMVSKIRDTEKVLGSNKLDLPPNEISYRLAHKKNPIARRKIRKGAILNESLFEFKRTKVKNSVSLYEFRGKKAAVDIPKGATLAKQMISKKSRRVAAVIACRVHSSRLFAKQMQLIGGKPIIEHMLNQLKTSKLIDEIVLAISAKPGNEVFVEYAHERGIKFVIGDDTDVLNRLINGAKYVNADIIFRITPENPYVYWEGIDDVIRKHVSGNYDFSDCYDLPLGSGYEVVNLDAFERSHREGSKRHRSELCSLYINENQEKFKIQHVRPPKQLQRPELRLTVDTPEDLVVARTIYDKLGKNGKPIRLAAIVKFLDKNQTLIKMNSNVPLGVSRIWIKNDPLRKNR